MVTPFDWRRDSNDVPTGWGRKGFRSPFLLVNQRVSSRSTFSPRVRIDKKSGRLDVRSLFARFLFDFHLSVKIRVDRFLN